MSALPFGVDISSYQGANINYDLMKQKTKFIAVRAGISWGFEDPVFAQSWQALKGHNRIAYHVLYPSQDVTMQVDWLFDILSRAGFDPKTDRLAIDIELWQGQTPQRVTEATTQMYDQITQRTGRKPIIYSAAWFVNPRMIVTPKLAAADWWLANYPPKGSAPGVEHPGPPILPRGITSYLIHQTSETGIGKNVGLPSGAIDTNRWNGTDDDVRAYFGLIEPPTEPPSDPDQPLYRAKVVATAGLNVRACPSMTCQKLRMNPYGAVLDVFEERDGWSRVHGTKQEWSLSQWLMRIGEPDPPVEPPQGDGMYYGALYWQRDPRWKDIMLGTKSTIGENGCAMTCVAIALGKLGVHVNPVSLNDWLTNNEGYYQNGNLILWDAVERMNPTIKWDGMTYAPSDDLIRQRIRAGKLPIIVVDSNEATPQEDMHWVVGIGVDRGNNIIIFDPWDNVVGKFRDRYKKPVIRFTGYSR
jgi:GH25 family lysozyme M1 (1,4-beta-N-acetylmuramidase)